MNESQKTGFHCPVCSLPLLKNIIEKNETQYICGAGHVFSAEDILDSISSGVNYSCHFTEIERDSQQAGTTTRFQEITSQKEPIASGMSSAVLESQDAFSQRATDKYHLILNNIDDAFTFCELVRDESGTPVDIRYLEFNAAFERQRGLSADALTGRTVTEVFGSVDPGVLQTYRDVVEKDEPAFFERFTDEEWYEVYAYPFQGDCFSIIFRNISARKKVENALRESEERKAYLLKLSDALRPLANPVDIQLTACRILGEHTGVSRVLYGEVLNEEMVLISNNYVNGVLPLVATLDAKEFGKELIDSYKRNEKVIFNDVATDPRFTELERKNLEAIAVGANASMGLLKDGKWVAAFGMQNLAAHNWTPMEITLMEETAERTWAAVEMAKAEQSLRTNEHRMRGQKEAFLTTVNGASVKDSLNLLTRLVSDETNGAVRTAFYAVDEHIKRLHPIFGSGNMPDSYLEEVDGFAIGMDSVACGLAIPTGKPVLTDNVFEEPLWKPWTYLAKKYGFQGSWSFPIVSRNNAPVGTFAMYFPVSYETTSRDLELAEVIYQAAAIIISFDNESQERSDAEIALRDSREMLARELADSMQLQKVSALLINVAGEGELYKQIVEAATVVMDSDFGSLQMLGEDGTLSLLAWKNFHPDSAKFWKVLSREEGTSCGASLSEGQRIIVTDVDHPECYLSPESMYHYRLSGIQSMQTTPLCSRDGQLVGAISTHWRRPHRPGNREIRLLEILARQAADFFERRRAEQSIRDSEERYRSLFEAMEEGYAVHEVLRNDAGGIQDLRFRFLNPALERISGLRLENVIGRVVSEIIPSLNDFTVFERVLKSGKSERFEQYFPELERWFDITVLQYGYAQVASLYDDITDRKQQEQHKEFMLKLVDSLRSLDDAFEIRSKACSLLQAQLGVEQVSYADVNEVDEDWIFDALEKGDVIVTNGKRDSNRQNAARITVPVIKAGQITGLLIAKENCVRHWQSHEVELVRETADRIRAAMDRARAESALRESEQRLRFTMENAIDYAFITLDLQYNITAWSTGAERIFGYNAEEAIGQPFSKLFTPEDIESGLPEQKMEEAVREGFAPDERWGVHKNGTRFFLNGIIRPVLNPELSGFVKVARDMTRQKLLDQQKDEFLGTASHELKTPVTSLKMYAEILEERFEDAGDFENAGIMRRMNVQVDRLTNLIRDLLDTSKITEGRLMFQPQRFDLNLLIIERVEEIQLTTNKHLLEFNGSTQNIYIEADRERIGQVLVNLLTNAIKYSPDEGPIQIRSFVRRDHVLVEIEDNGIGIPADSITRIFDRFFRADTASLLHTYPGMGLGLYISAAIIERHAGKIFVQSKESRGSMFSFQLPYQYIADRKIDLDKS